MKSFIQSVLFILVMTLLLGGAYPFFITAISQWTFHNQANGSMIEKNGQVVGATLIAQPFTKPQYFWPRPSACSYNPASSGSNLSGGSRTLHDQVANHKKAGEPLFASGSGLDPHISPEEALKQVDRVAQARHLDATHKQALIAKIAQLTEPRTFGFMGESRINVLKLNLALDNQ